MKTQKSCCGKEKLEKNVMVSGYFSEIGRNLKRGEMHHYLWGMDASVNASWSKLGKA